ncbi:MAG: hypothetical protein V3V99_10365 [candidate division Zixibacteria bacterium]
MATSGLQIVVNMFSALVMFIGGMAIAIYYPGTMGETFRWVIGIFVSFYFVARIGQSIVAFKQIREKENEGLHELVEELERDDGSSKIT